MLRFLVLLLAALWAIPRVLRLLGSGLKRAGGRGDRLRPEPDKARSPQDEHLQNLTQQDIADAEFEEIPPEE